MSKRPNWARASNQYVKRAGVPAPTPPAGDRLPIAEPPWAVKERTGDAFEATGVTWSAFDISQIKPSTIERTRHRFRSHLPDLIWNTAALEGNNFTLPEVRTLLEGVTVGGQKLEDEQQILDLSEAYNRLDEMVATRRFSLSKAITDELNGLVAVHEAIEAGHFRGEGQVEGGGTVSLASGGSVAGTPHGPGGEFLWQHFADLVDYLEDEADPRRRALIYFASATRRQFYFDGNKRTARLMLTGELMSNGFDIVSVPFNRRLEFNVALDVLFEHDDATELLDFLGTCALGEA